MLSKALTTAAAGSAGGDYQISRSLRFNSADSARLNKTFSTTPSDRGKWTISVWIKRGLIGTGWFPIMEADSTSGSDTFSIYDDKLYIGIQSGVRSVTIPMVFRDPSSWYHLLISWDDSETGLDSTLSIYVNGVQQTGYSALFGSLLLDTDVFNFGNAVDNRIGSRSSGTAYYFDGLMADFHLLDGIAASPSSFGEVDSVTGVWKPIRYAGTYGTNGFHLDFSDNSSTTALGYDAAGSNDWTPNNFSVTAGVGNDSLVDSPTQYGTDTGAGGEVRGNYCTWNPLDKNNGTGFVNNGNLDASDSNTAGTSSGVRSTLGASSGKWYFEVTVSSLSGNSGNNVMIGVSDLNYPLSSAGWGSANAWTYYASNGNKYNGGSSSAYGATYTQNDVIGVAVDSDNGTLTFYKNGVSQGQAYSGLTGKNLAPYFGTAFEVMVVTLNTGQRPFAYTAPSGFKALCTTNLPDPTVLQGREHFGTLLYTGTAGVQTVTTEDIQFTPDWMWFKQRDTTRDHYLYDIVRGFNKDLHSNLANVESTTGSKTPVFGGVTLNETFIGTNASGGSFAAWSWKANGAGSSNTDGTITSTVSANTTAGISIVTYTGNGTAGATVGHGLGAVPKMMLIKGRSTSYDWRVYHASVGNGYIGFLNTTAAFSTNTTWNNTTPSSTVFTLGSELGANQNSATHLALVFSEVEGFSKFGSYTGNGSTDGPFVYTGFRPAFILYKQTNTTRNWHIVDAVRDSYNAGNKQLYPNLSNAEYSAAVYNYDIVSNGFKLRGTDIDMNQSGGTYIYMAFAKNPFKYSLGR